MASALVIPHTATQPPAITARTPAENLERSLSQLRDCGVSVNVKTVSSKWSDGDYVPVRSAFVDIAKDADTARAENIVAAMQAPASSDDIEKWLIVASVLMARADKDADENELVLAAYTHILLDYPGDVVRELLDPKTGIPRQMTFFPKPHELCTLADKMCGERGIILKELTDPRFPREWWERQAEDYIETTDWKVSYGPGPETTNCPMPTDLLVKCRNAHSRRREAQDALRKEMQDEGVSYLETDPAEPQFEEPKVSREDLDAKREAQKAALLDTTSKP